ncbi:hypothetical protein DL96DRAFT_1701899 [Flagelloscypha sp. PMI_526]|nr:hypothetical protein DL96DRAFT_1701899 [Flagelloscypha sp. PMI_526]
MNVLLGFRAALLSARDKGRGGQDDDNPQAPTTSTSSSPASSNGTSINVPALIGGVVGGVVLLAVISGLVIWWWLRRRARHSGRVREIDLTSESPSDTGPEVHEGIEVRPTSFTAQPSGVINAGDEVRHEKHQLLRSEDPSSHEAHARDLSYTTVTSGPSQMRERLSKMEGEVARLRHKLGEDREPAGESIQGLPPPEYQPHEDVAFSNGHDLGAPVERGTAVTEGRPKPEEVANDVKDVSA